MIQIGWVRIGKGRKKCRPDAGWYWNKSVSNVLCKVVEPVENLAVLVPTFRFRLWFQNRFRAGNEKKIATINLKKSLWGRYAAQFLFTLPHKFQNTLIFSLTKCPKNWKNDSFNCWLKTWKMLEIVWGRVGKIFKNSRDDAGVRKEKKRKKEKERKKGKIGDWTVFRFFFFFFYVIL